MLESVAPQWTKQGLKSSTLSHRQVIIIMSHASTHLPILILSSWSSSHSSLVLNHFSDIKKLFKDESSRVKLWSWCSESFLELYQSSPPTTTHRRSNSLVMINHASNTVIIGDFITAVCILAAVILHSYRLCRAGAVVYIIIFMLKI